MRTLGERRAFTLPELVVGLVCGALLLGTLLSVFSGIQRATLALHGAAGADRALALIGVLGEPDVVAAGAPATSVSRDGIHISITVSGGPDTVGEGCTYRVQDASGDLEARFRNPPAIGGLRMLSLPDPMAGPGASGSRFRYLIQLESDGRE